MALKPISSQDDSGNNEAIIQGFLQLKWEAILSVYTHNTWKDIFAICLESNTGK